ncbi:Gfo/Idh/MocA family protein [Paenibacillus solisilvae]|uniref:Gfo/Idh/MocA family protein n=1 Tax=Paenibacillus solisilvae TaxID=2486751 RepID=A0ABW0W1J8_9BACL
MDKIKVGIIGTGFSASFHLEALRRLPQVEVAAVAGSSLAKAEAMASKYAIRKAYQSHEELIDDKEVEVVHNCTPNDLHYAINTRILEAQKHLLSEKPLAMNSEESAKLAVLAEETPVISGVCYNYRHYPLVAEARRRIHSGQVGKLNLITGGYLQDWLMEETDYNWRLHPERSGPSRAVADIGSHWCDLLQHVTGQQIVEVLADLKIVHPIRLKRVSSSEDESWQPEFEKIPITTEDFGHVLVHFDGGAKGVFTVSQVSAGRKNKIFFEIAGSNESVQWDQENPNKLWIGRRGGANRVIGTDPEELPQEVAAMVHYPGGHEEGWPDGVKNLFLDFYEAVAAHKEGLDYNGGSHQTFASVQEGHYMMRINEAIVESFHKKTWVSIG